MDVSTGEIERVVAGQHHDPHSVLGAHPGPAGVTIRALRPFAAAVTAVLPDGERIPLRHRHAGVFEGIAGLPAVPDYRLEVTYEGEAGTTNRSADLQDDPYRHLPTLGELDLYLIGEGRHEQLWRVLGAHPRPDGTSFAVWAPNARGVRLVGDFNYWDGTTHPMRSLGGAGVWELFVPGVGPGTKYKYSICGPDALWREKADPMASLAEKPPATASVVFESAYDWGDARWLARREQGQAHREPLSIYEVHLGSWRPGLSYRELAAELVPYVRDMGFTHVELLPVAEHPFGPSWGYQITSYYAPTSRFGTPDDFRFLVDSLHAAGIGVILDWVPGHFPRDEWALARFDGTPLYEHGDPRLGEHPDWGTLVFNYGRAEVRNFLVANALYWFSEFHIDGLRVDAVASMLYLDYSREAGQWVPNRYGGRENLEAISLLQEANSVCYAHHQGIMMIAEESTAWPGVTRPVHAGGLGFGFKWNMGWMNDTLSYLRRDPIHRQFHHNELTFSLVYAFTENFILPLSHDEVVHGKGSLLAKMPGDEWRRFAGVRGLFGYMWAHPGKQLLFMGSEWAQGNEWSDANGLDWWMLDFDVHAGVQRLVRDLNTAYRAAPALWSCDNSGEGFAWLDVNDAASNLISFLRFAQDPPADAAASPDATGSSDAAGSSDATGSLDATGSAGPAGSARSAGGATAVSAAAAVAPTPDIPAARVLACVANFSAVPHSDYQIGLPCAGPWHELLNTDDVSYGGSGVLNRGTIKATADPWHGQPASARIVVPPLGVTWLVPG